MRLNRLQNKFDLILADASSGNGRVILTEEEDFYIKEPSDDKVVFLKDGIKANSTVKTNPIS